MPTGWLPWDLQGPKNPDPRTKDEDAAAAGNGGRMAEPERPPDGCLPLTREALSWWPRYRYGTAREKAHLGTVLPERMLQALARLAANVEGCRGMAAERMAGPLLAGLWVPERDRARVIPDLARAVVQTGAVPDAVEAALRKALETPAPAKRKHRAVSPSGVVDGELTRYAENGPREAPDAALERMFAGRKAERPGGSGARPGPALPGPAFLPAGEVRERIFGGAAAPKEDEVTAVAETPRREKPEGLSPLQEDVWDALAARGWDLATRYVTWKESEAIAKEFRCSTAGVRSALNRLYSVLGLDPPKPSDAPPAEKVAANGHAREPVETDEPSLLGTVLTTLADGAAEGPGRGKQDAGDVAAAEGLAESAATEEAAQAKVRRLETALAAVRAEREQTESRYTEALRAATELAMELTRLKQAQGETVAQPVRPKNLSHRFMALTLAHQLAVCAELKLRPDGPISVVDLCEIVEHALGIVRREVLG